MGYYHYIHAYVVLKIHFVELLKQINKDNFDEIICLLSYGNFDNDVYYENEIVYKKLFCETIWYDTYNLSQLIEDIEKKCENEYSKKYEVDNNDNYIYGKPEEEYNEDILKNIIKESTYEKVIQFLNDIQNKNFYVYLFHCNYSSNLLHRLGVGDERTAQSFSFDAINVKKKEVEELQKKLNLTNCEIVVYVST